MKRDRAFIRKMRVKHIKRKKNITAHYRAWDDYPYYQFDGMYSKNKIHCSCPLCKSKAWYGKHMLTRQEQKQKLNEREFRNEN